VTDAELDAVLERERAWSEAPWGPSKIRPAEMAALTAALREARAVLREVATREPCPLCGGPAHGDFGYSAAGHNYDCALARALGVGR
jgi:hypothetical protein